MKHFAVFSEAIREGAKTGPQTSLLMIDERGATCALGAAARAIGFSEKALTFGCYPQLVAMYPYLKTIEAICPVSGSNECDHGDYLQIGGEDVDAGLVITHLNDEHQWTREQIADWLSDREEEMGFILITEEEPEKEIVFARTF